MSRPRLLDLFAGAGGSAVGYYRAGFDVVGVDVVDQPHYPFELHVADALTFPPDGFDAVHASPPCRDHSALATVRGRTGTGWLLAATRERLVAWGGPYVIENVPGAPLVAPVQLCGSVFLQPVRCGDGRLRQLRRHRLFESNVPIQGVQCAGHRWPSLGVYGQGPARYEPERGRRGAYQGNPAENSAAMGIDWMDRDELAQAIPPAYTEEIGAFLLSWLADAQRAVLAGRMPEVPA